MVVIALLYLLFITYLIFRVFGIPKDSELSEKTSGDISIIIPFRNEEENLNDLLFTLEKQDINSTFEVILVNDGSSDGYLQIIEQIREEYSHFTVKVVDSHYDSSIHLTSKQQAIECGVENSSYEWLVFTDADMKFSPKWLSNLLSYGELEKRPFIFGRTAVMKNPGILSFIQKVQLDFLFATAWLFSNAGLDSSCMGNNILISRELYKKVGGQHGLGYTIVEDKKLLSAIKKTGVIPVPARPFLPDAETKPVNSLNTYIHQMLRWLKGGSTESIQILIIVLLLGGELLALILGITEQLSQTTSLLSLSGAAATWLLYIFLFIRLKTPVRGILFPLFFIFLILESLIVLPSLLFVTPKWKGRKLT